MLLTITTTLAPATELGRLLHKHPDRLQSFDLAFGRALVFYPEASADRCTAALHVEVDAVERSEQRRGRGQDAAYVSDRPYAAGSYLPGAMSRVFGTAMSGRCDARPDLAAAALPLEIVATPVACRSTASPADLFGPLGWTVGSEALPLDPAFPEWGGGVHRRVRLSGSARLADALRHLAVLLPVLDGTKHYRFADDEVEKLLRLGEGWLDAHPARALIVRRYLGRRRPLVEAAEEALAADDPDSGADAADPPDTACEAALERPARLQEVRVATALDMLARSGARRVADVGCGEGDLVEAVLRDRRFDGVVGVDPSPHALARCARRIGYERMQEGQRARVALFQGAATYPDARLKGCDAVALLEVVEHVDPWRLGMLEDAVFGAAAPRLVLVTTPNRERNALFPGLPEGALRHRDHRFEWTRDEFRAWCAGVGGRRGYAWEWFPVGDEAGGRGPITQGALFTRGA